MTDAVVAFEIETITKYNLYNKSKGFDEETNVENWVLSTVRKLSEYYQLWENYLSTINSEKTI